MKELILFILVGLFIVRPRLQRVPVRRDQRDNF
ncbi:hypothetical protein A5866_000416 [Enterococcus sp. 12C11_DIV0727]|uniref:Uncharacterized protein n=1 Tax=Candidatus Enterococcus lemimoniae TaxID=1834167 RepID=A0ABZ2T1Z5_9ENTE|nr:hypothetical protein A5866_001610 [Enterococcus sp. 12C11_DIV0727]